MRNINIHNADLLRSSKRFRGFSSLLPCVPAVLVASTLRVKRVLLTQIPGRQHRFVPTRMDGMAPNRNLAPPTRTDPPPPPAFVHLLVLQGTPRLIKLYRLLRAQLCGPLLV